RRRLRRAREPLRDRPLPVERRLPLLQQVLCRLIAGIERQRLAERRDGRVVRRGALGPGHGVGNGLLALALTAGLGFALRRRGANRLLNARLERARVPMVGIERERL